MLKGDLLESQSWLRCSPACAGQDVTPNSNLAGASLILYLNLLTQTHGPSVCALLFCLPCAGGGQERAGGGAHRGGVQDDYIFF